MDNRCDGMLTYPYAHAIKCAIIFIELKDRDYKNIVWIEKGEEQLRSTIAAFANNYDIARYKPKKAYIANREKPNFQYSHQTRMRQFKNETGFILMIQATIRIDS